MKIYLIRHGLTDAILHGLYCGSTDVHINEKGRLLLEQNATRGLYPSGQHISLFAASALARTSQTLRTIYGNDAEPVTSANFNEIDFGDYEMKTDSELRDDSEYRVWIDQYLHQGPPHGESVDELWRRMAAGFEELNALYKNTGDILLVSHGISIAVVLYKLFAYPLLLSVPQPGEGYAVELGFDLAGHLLPSAARFLNRISDLEKNSVLWKKPQNFSDFTNKKSELTILHANDLHGEFLFKAREDYTIHGGISLLSGYIKKTRQENPNVLFTISGDLMEKSLLDKSVKGIDAVDIYNYLSPDLISPGNHELNYGITQLLLFEKCTNFPIINANLYTRYLQQSLLAPYHIKTVNGIRMMFIGVLEKAMFKKMPVSDFEREALEYRDSLSQIKQICGLYKTPDIDFVILLSHLGIEKDRELARAIPKECGVSIILGGHSHIRMEKLVMENDVLIVQSDYGSEYLGRLDLVFDHQKQSISDLNWELVSIDSETCDVDKEFDVIVDEFLESRCSEKPGTLCTLTQRLTHEKRYECTPLGRLLADAYLDIYAVDIIWFPSKNIRTPSCGPTVTYMNLLQMLPYDGAFVRIELSGDKIMKLLQFIFPDTPQGTVIIPLQYSKGFEVSYDCKSCKMEVRFHGEALLRQEKHYVVGMPAYLYERFSIYFGETPDDTLFKKRILSSSMLTDLSTYLKAADQPLAADPKPRIVYLNREWRDWGN